MSEVMFADAKQDFSASVKSVKAVGSETRMNESWLSHVPVGVRRIAAGTAFAVLMAFSSGAHAQEAKPAVETACVTKAQYSVVPDAKLKSEYDSYKKGKLDEDTMNARIAVAAARFVKEQKLDSKNFSEVLKSFREVLEQWCKCNDKCGTPTKKAPAVVTGPPTTGDKKASKDNGKKEVAAPAQVDQKANEQAICDMATKQGKKLEGCDKLKFTAPTKAADGKDANKDKTDGKKKDEPQKPTVTIVRNENQDKEDTGEEKGKTSEPEDNKALTKTIKDKEKESAVKRFEIAVPMGGAYVNILDPYGRELNAISGSAPVVLSVGLSDHFGLSVMGGYDGGNYSLNEGSSSRHASLLGAGVQLKFDDLSMNALATLNGELARESWGLMLMMNSHTFRLLASTQFREDAPTRLAMEYWDTQSDYPVIFQMDGMLGSFQDGANISNYLVQAGTFQVQLPIWKDMPIYPNVVIGGLMYNMNANPNYKFLGAGEVGGSLTWRFLNAGAAYLIGGTAYRGHFDTANSTYDHEGKKYNGELLYNAQAVDGWTVFGNAKIVSINDTVDLNASFRYIKIGSNSMFLPGLGIIIRW